MKDTIYRRDAIDAVCMEWCNVKHQDCKHPFDVEKDDYYWCDGCETVLRTLPDLPSAEPEPPEDICGECDAWNQYKQKEPCEDAVSRKKVIGIFTALWECIGTIMDRDEWEDACRTTANELPAAQPEQKTGKWIRESLVTDYPYKCSACKKYSRAMYDFCPNCGAKMKEEEVSNGSD